MEQDKLIIEKSNVFFREKEKDLSERGLKKRGGIKRNIFVTVTITLLPL